MSIQKFASFCGREKWFKLCSVDVHCSPLFHRYLASSRCHINQRRAHFPSSESSHRVSNNFQEKHYYQKE